MRGRVSAGRDGAAERVLFAVVAAAPKCLLAPAHKPCKTPTQSKLHLDSVILFSCNCVSMAVQCKDAVTVFTAMPAAACCISEIFSKMIIARQCTKNITNSACKPDAKDRHAYMLCWHLLSCLVTIAILLVSSTICIHHALPTLIQGGLGVTEPLPCLLEATDH